MYYNNLNAGPNWAGNYIQPDTGKPAPNAAVGAPVKANLNPMNVGAAVTPYVPPADVRPVVVSPVVGVNKNPLGASASANYQAPTDPPKAPPPAFVQDLYDPLQLGNKRPATFTQEPDHLGAAWANQGKGPTVMHAANPDAFAPPLPIKWGGTITPGSQPPNQIVGCAEYPCVATDVRAMVQGDTGSTINAGKNFSQMLLANDLLLSQSNVWILTTAVENASFQPGDTLEIVVTNVVGAPQSIVIQVDMNRLG